MLSYASQRMKLWPISTRFSCQQKSGWGATAEYYTPFGKRERGAAARTENMRCPVDSVQTARRSFRQQTPKLQISWRPRTLFILNSALLVSPSLKIQIAFSFPDGALVCLPCTVVGRLKEEEWKKVREREREGEMGGERDSELGAGGGGGRG